MASLEKPSSDSLREGNISEIVSSHAAHSPDSIAIITPILELTYRELNRQVERYSDLLAERGVRAEDRVALIVSDERIFLLSMLAAARLAAAALPIPRSSTPSQRSEWIRRASVSFVVSDLAVGLNGSGGQTHIDTQWLEFATPAAVREKGLGTGFDPSQAIFAIVVGSGSTGQQKLIPITHAQMRSRAERLRSSLEVSPQDRLASLSHLEYAAGFHRLLCALYSGASFVVLESPRSQWREWRSRYGLTILAATASHVQQMLNALPETDHPNELPLDGTKLTLSSSVVTQELRESVLMRLSKDLNVNYGTNETWSVTVAKPSDLLQHDGTVGRPLPGVRVRIVDEELRPLPKGQVGLIAIQSDQVIAGYMDDEEASRQAFRDGWFIPGDLGRFTDDGQVIYCGRSDNLMIFNGIKIYPIEIEQCLMSHPEVLDVFAMPMRHPIHQDVPVAFVVLRAHASSTGEELRQYAASVLGAKRPRRVFVVDEIPRNPQGKPIKAELEKLLPAHGKPAIPPTQARWGQMAIAFIPRDESAAQHLASWVSVLNSDSTIRLQAIPAIDSASGEAVGWLEQVLALLMGLLHAARVPVFEPLEVIDCRPDPSNPKHWKGTCQLPDPALVSNNTMTALVVEAFKLAHWASTASVEVRADLAGFFQQVEEGALKLLASSKSRGKSTFELLRVAHSLAIPYRPLAGGAFQLGWGRHSRCIDRSTTDHDSALGMRWTQDKFLTAQRLREAGLPAPVHGRATSLSQAQELARQFGYPVVVKPTDLERGVGVAVDVVEDGLEKAFQVACQQSPSKTVLIERQIPGVCHRLFIAAGELLYAVKRLPMGVYGDGISSLTDLVMDEFDAQQRLAPWRRSGIQPIDAIALDMIRVQGLEPRGVPPAGQFVALRRIESTAWGGVDEEVTEVVHPDNVRAAIRAARLLGLEVAGVDMISLDITQAWHVNGAVINEVNYAPLLGGGDISRRHIPEFLNRILRGDGRIPIHIWVGGDEAWTQAIEQWKHLRANGAEAFLTAHDRTLDADGNAYTLVATDLCSRVQGLLMQSEVGALVVVARSAQEAQVIRALDPATLRQSVRPRARQNP